jgi:hypothetical protein
LIGAVHRVEGELEQTALLTADPVRHDIKRLLPKLTLWRVCTAPLLAMGKTRFCSAGDT